MQIIKSSLLKSRCRNFSSILFFFALFSMAGCYNDKQEILNAGSDTAADCGTTPAKFGADIQPLILSKCAIPSCHNASSAMGGLTFETWQQISASKARINIRAVVEKSMPPTGPLLPAEISKLKCWIDGGGLNN